MACSCDVLSVTRFATVRKRGCENCIELQELGSALACLRRRKRLFELLIPQLNELLNFAVVQIHGTYGTGRQERVAEGENCRSRLVGNLAMFILRFHSGVVKNPHCGVRVSLFRKPEVELQRRGGVHIAAHLASGEVERLCRLIKLGTAAKHIDPRGLRCHVGGNIRVFDQLRGFTGRPQVLEELRRARDPAFVYPEPFRPIIQEYEPHRRCRYAVLCD